jgi:hypothetical protein
LVKEILRPIAIAAINANIMFKNKKLNTNERSLSRNFKNGLITFETSRKYEIVQNTPKNSECKNNRL